MSLPNPYQAGLGSLAQSKAALQSQYNAFLYKTKKSKTKNNPPPYATSLQQAMMQQQAAAQNAMIYNTFTGTSNATSSAFTQNMWISPTTTTTGTSQGWISPGNVEVYERIVMRDKVNDGEAVLIDLPDGTKIDVKKDGSYSIKDKDATIIYRANRIRNFNQFMNVSDRLEEFIDFCGKQGVQRAEMMEIPVKLFIGWLIIEAAKADREAPPDDIKLIPDLRKVVTPRCPGCGRYLPRFAIERKVPFCAPPCFERYYLRAIPEPLLLEAA